MTSVPASPPQPEPVLKDERQDAEAKERARRESPGALADASARPMGRASVQASLAEPPERWLERIAQLRTEGKHAEADKELAEFRRRHPDYHISDAVLQKVERK
jgi:hypothetical protein